MLKKITAFLNIILFVIFVMLVFFDFRLSSFSRLYFSAFVLFVPLLNLFALEFVEISLIKRIFSNKKIKILVVALVLSILSLSLILMTQGEDSELYITSFSKIISEDDTYSGSLNPKKIYISKNTYSETFLDKIEGVIPNEVLRELKRHGESIGLNIIIYDSKYSLSFNEFGEVVGGGVIVKFGILNKMFLISELEASIYVAGLAAGGTYYRFHRWFGGWNLYSSESSWIS